MAVDQSNNIKEAGHRSTDAEDVEMKTGDESPARSPNLDPSTNRQLKGKSSAPTAKPASAI